MRFLALNECWQWCAEHSVILNSRKLPAPDASLMNLGRLVYVEEPHQGVAVRQEVLAACLNALGDWDECLLWITLWGVWPSTEDWPTYYLLRGSLRERRSLEEAPGHLATRNDRAHVAELLDLVMKNGWEAHVLASRDAEVCARAFLSHDEWVALASRVPFAVSKPAV